MVVARRSSLAAVVQDTHYAYLLTYFTYFTYLPVEVVEGGEQPRLERRRVVVHAEALLRRVVHHLQVLRALHELERQLRQRGQPALQRLQPRARGVGTR